MAKQLIPEELDLLIQEYLTDGVLTDKERAVILRKAEGMGLDRDEIDLYLDAQVQKIDQATDAAARRQKGKQCPYCGESVPQLTDKCPHCGGSITAEASQELQEIFDNLEEALVNLKSGKDIHTSKAIVERYARKAKMYYGNNPKVQKLLEGIEKETINAEKNARSIVRKNTIVSVLTYNKKLTAAVFIVLLGLILWGGYSIFKGPDVENDPKACIAAVKKAIESGDIDKAAAYCTAYDRHHIASDIATGYALTSKAYMEAGQYQEALSLVHGDFFLSDIEFNLRKEIVNKCISEGEFDKAEDYGDFRYDGYARYYDYICKCIDYMKSHGESNQKIKMFIDRKITRPDPGYGEWDPQTYPAKLYKYAGIN